MNGSISRHSFSSNKGRFTFQIRDLDNCYIRERAMYAGKWLLAIGVETLGTGPVQENHGPTSNRQKALHV